MKRKLIIGVALTSILFISLIPVRPTLPPITPFDQHGGI